MNTPRATRVAWALYLLVGSAVLAACGTTPPSRFYVLAPAADQAAARDAPGMTVRVEAVRVPKTVQRPQIASRVSAHELDYSEYHRWAEPLDDNLTRALVADLRTLLPGARIFGRDDLVVPAIDVTVAVDIRELQATLGDSCMLSARWQLSDGSAWLSAGEGSFEVATVGDDYGALVAALSAAVAELADQVAASIIEHPAPEPEAEAAEDAEPADEGE